MDSEPYVRPTPCTTPGAPKMDTEVDNEASRNRRLSQDVLQDFADGTNQKYVLKALREL